VYVKKSNTDKIKGKINGCTSIEDLEKLAKKFNPTREGE
jgi:hypothetical protein